MQIRLTVLGPRSGHATRVCDVLITAPAGTALAAVASGMADAVAASGAGPAAGDATTGAVVLYAGSERLDPRRCALGEPPLTDGAVLSLQVPAEPGRHPGVPQAVAASDAVARLHVVAGPDAGGVHLLRGGQVRIGRSADADVPLDDPDVSRLHCAVTVSEDGRVTVADLESTNGTAVDDTPVDTHPAPLPPGALLRIGESALRLEPGPAAIPLGALPTAPDGAGHLRVTRPDPGFPPAAAGFTTQAYGTLADLGGAGAAPGPVPRGPARAAPGGGFGQSAGHGLAPDPDGAFAAHLAGPSPGPDRRRCGADEDAAGGGRDGAHERGPVVPVRERVRDGGHGADDTGGDPGAARTADGGQDAEGGGREPGTEAHAHGTAAPGARHWTPARGTPVPEGRAPDRGPGAAGRTGADHEPGADERDGADERPGAEGRFGAAGRPGAEGRFGADEGEASAPSTRTGPRRGRGIGAWARRLTGVRADERQEPGDPGAVGVAARATAEAAALRARWPDPADLLLTALGPGPRLWERGPGHPDALVLRLGTADRPASGGRGVLVSAPVTVGLRQSGALGLAGPRARLAGLARSVVAQLAALHSPSALELVLIGADRARSAAERTAEWGWLGWLPHVRPARGQDCRLLLAYDHDQAAARVAELVRRLDDGPLGPGWAGADPAAIADAARRHNGRRTVLIVDGDPGSAALRETIARLAAVGPSAGVHVVCLAEAPPAPLTELFEAARAVSPVFSECGAVAVLSGDVATTLRVIRPAADSPGAVPGAAERGRSGPGPDGPVATVDAVSAAWAERFARALAPLRADDSGTGGSADPSRPATAALPRSARLLDELGLARATPASLMARWAAAADAGPTGSGRTYAVLGAGPRGPLAVDPAADGPHLLVEGGPGSGKTELLRSLAASLAAADRPDRVSLVLVDGAGAEGGEGLRSCTDLPHVSTYLPASDAVRMRAFAQALGAELKRRAELLGDLEFVAWHTRRASAARLGPRHPGESAGADRPGELESSRSGTLKLRARENHGPAARENHGPAARGDGSPGVPGGPGGGAGAGTAAARSAGPGGAADEDPLPRLIVIVDDFDALVAPALGSAGRPAAGSVVRALEAVAREGARLGVHLLAATGRPDRTARTAAAESAGLRVVLDAPSAGADGTEGTVAGDVPVGRGRLVRRDGVATPFQAGRVSGRIPRTATLRPTVVTIDWERMGDPPARRPVRELGNGPTDLALLASALQRAAQSAAAGAAPPLV